MQTRDRYARLAAEKFGTQHYDMTISADDFAAFLPKYVWHMEEPVCEPPAIALYYVSKLARNYVTVLLSGEGGDEAFAGYSNYRNLVWLERIKAWRTFAERRLRQGYVPCRLSCFDSSSIFKVRALDERSLSRLLLQSYFKPASAPPETGWARSIPPTLRERLTANAASNQCARCKTHVRGQNTLDAMLYIDTKTWLPDDLLIKADKMTMANSIELRVPLLDHKVLEFAASLPPRLKLNGRNTKYILKKALSKKIPREIRNRKKAGFPVPYASWLRNELKDVVWDVLTDGKTISRGYFRKDAVEKLTPCQLERRRLLQRDILAAQPGAVATHISGEGTSCPTVN